tara:strand:+ start:4346 stop:4513 length:168 start_codon:yes stop_codon:yes gene_type:complete
MAESSKKAVPDHRLKPLKHLPQSGPTEVIEIGLLRENKELRRQLARRIIELYPHP